MRSDGRQPADIRQITIKQGELQRADGSARWTQGGTSILAAIHGPTDTVPSKEQPDRAAITVVWKPRSTEPSPQDRSYEAVLRELVQLVVVTGAYPRTVIEVVVQVVGEDGSLLAGAVNAVNAALMDAGIQMHNGLVAMSVGCLQAGDLILDPTKEEESTKSSTATTTGCFAFNTATLSNVANIEKECQPVLSIVQGRTSAETVEDFVKAARLGCQQLAKFVQQQQKPLS